MICNTAIPDHIDRLCVIMNDLTNLLDGDKPYTVIPVAGKRLLHSYGKPVANLQMEINNMLYDVKIVIKQWNAKHSAIIDNRAELMSIEKTLTKRISRSLES